MYMEYSRTAAKLASHMDVDLCAFAALRERAGMFYCSRIPKARGRETAYNARDDFA